MFNCVAPGCQARRFELSLIHETGFRCGGGALAGGSGRAFRQPRTTRKTTGGPSKTPADMSSSINCCERAVLRIGLRIPGTIPSRTMKAESSACLIVWGHGASTTWSPRTHHAGVNGTGSPRRPLFSPKRILAPHIREDEPVAARRV